MSDRSTEDILEIENVPGSGFFLAAYRARKPFVIRNFLYKNSDATQWNFEYLNKQLSGKILPLKEFQANGDIICSSIAAEIYIEQVLQYEKQLKDGNQDLSRPAYCHDVPIFHLADSLIEDVKHIEERLFPELYQQEWWKYAQFFMSATGSITPLHYDTLLTHNVFFQAYGRKEFVLIEKKYSQYCYRKGWRWFQVDPNNVDWDKFPLFEKAKLQRVELNAGDLLYMPPGMLHHVTTLDASLSFNVDFHTKSSVLRSFLSTLDHMPKATFYYNWLVMMGLVAKLPSRWLFKFYKPYLNYVS
ncbi:cupin-like domain-containing protein [Gynuella sunshinyii]|uniref:JmjC domain-containing protein n=1 Tax=Gynuella sunshinyii YC6258 TaxID=1445510 RepID=A0A0C5VL14_9GAMM|nr:cupin-like domain-containing protein [Gynuella sunshinyii]AJQ95387.1 hypothetical protein YC6258_03351 [Gynuella sunshinyii YC6258]